MNFDCIFLLGIFHTLICKETITDDDKYFKKSFIHYLKDKNGTLKSEMEIKKTRFVARRGHREYRTLNKEIINLKIGEGELKVIKERYPGSTNDFIWSFKNGTKNIYALKREKCYDFGTKYFEEEFSTSDFSNLNYDYRIGGKIEFEKLAYQ